MAGGKIAPNMFFINAPAGSGKTHFIKVRINEIVEKDTSARILCITYTERAAKELQARVLSHEVFISTIHSFINYFISPYYAHPESIDLYYELYKSDIEKKIKDNEALETDDSQNRNSKYLISKGIDTSLKLSINLLRGNTKSIHYNEKNYNSLYYGGLSHDDLLIFSFEFLERYPVLKFRLREMFQYIFIDEVQDTDAKILRLFYNAAQNTPTEIYCFGDKMQEIYDNYDGTFENEFANFDTSLSRKFQYNYRSSEEIVIVLNHLYGRVGSDEQRSKIGHNGIKPKMMICSNIETYYTEHISAFDNFLVLRIANRARFARSAPDESMENVFEAISDIYPQGSRIKVVDVMLPPAGEDSPDILMNLFFILDRIEKYIKNDHYAAVIQLLNSQKFINQEGQSKKLFHPSMSIYEHDDKKRLQTTLKKVYKEYSKDAQYSLEQFLEYLTNQDIIAEDFIEHIRNVEDDEGKAVYTQLFQIQLSELKRLARYKDNQSVSTQHGVKGEGYPKICFWGEDSRRYKPYVYMYDFFKLYTQLEIFSLDSFQSFYYEFKSAVTMLEQKVETRISKLRGSDIKEQNIHLFDKIIADFKSNDYFNYFFHESIDEYESKRDNGKLPTLKSIQEIFKPDKVDRTLVAYKLFYVGCSRAKDELVVLINQEQISTFEREFRTKMSGAGFVLPNQ